jgi:diguanylate cyclase (GGDEF)-like protein
VGTAKSIAGAGCSTAQLDIATLHDTRRKRVIGVACVAGIAILGAALPVRIVLAGAVGPVVWIGGVLCIALAVAWLIRERAPDAAAMTVLGTIALGYPLLAAQAGGFDAPVLLAIPMVPILVVPFAGARRALWLTGALIMGGAAVWLGERYGFVAPSLLSPTGTRLMRATLAIFSLFAGTWMATAVERERRNLEVMLVAQTRTLYEASVRDPLTHLYNRRHLAERLAQELAFSIRHGTPLSVVLIDIDHFKRINDELGHGAGDEALIAVSARLEASVRREDVVARHGGEEFAILLRGLDIEGARTVAERMRVAIDARPFAVGGKLRDVAISAGCASLACCDAPTADALLAAADSRLYAAKRDGRNRVVSHG